jgi:hypothetical protein
MARLWRSCEVARARLSRPNLMPHDNDSNKFNPIPSVIPSLCVCVCVRACLSRGGAAANEVGGRRAELCEPAGRPATPVFGGWICANQLLVTDPNRVGHFRPLPAIISWASTAPAHARGRLRAGGPARGGQTAALEAPRLKSGSCIISCKRPHSAAGCEAVPASNSRRPRAATTSDGL